MGSIGPNAVVHSGSGLAIAVGCEVIRVPSGNQVVALEVCVRDHMVKISLEEGNLPRHRISEAELSQENEKLRALIRQ